MTPRPRYDRVTRSSLLAPAALIVLVLLSFWRLVFSSRHTFLDYGDLVFQVLPWLQVQARAWHQGVFPLWDPYVWNGQSLLGQGQPGAAFPLNWPLFLMPLDPAGQIQLRSVHWHFVAMHALAAVLAYAWVRTVRGSRFAAVFAGLAFATLGYVGTVWWPQMLHGAIWIPLTFLCARRAAACRGRRSWAWAILCGGAVGFAFLSGHHQAPLFGALALASYVIHLLFRRRRERGRLLLRFAAAGAVAVFMSGFQMLPAIEYGQAAYRWVGLPQPVTFDETVPLEAHRAWSLEPRDFLHLVAPVEGFEESPHLGLTVLSLAAFGVWTGRRRAETWYFVALTVVTALYTLGPATPVHRILYATVPMVEKARSPERAIYIVQFALITLAALGFDRVRLKPRHVVQALLLTAMFVEGQAGRSSRIHPISDAPVLDMLFEYDEALDFLERQPQPFRFLIRTPDKPNMGAWLGLEDSHGYLASISRGVYDFFWRDWRHAELALNTVYEIAREPAHENQSQVFRGHSGWNVYRNPDVRPRAWFEGTPAECNASANYRRIHLQHVEVDAELDCAATLVIADPYFPGWLARVDAAAADLRPFQDALMQLELPPGRHKVELFYRPGSAILGAAMTAAACGACAIALLFLLRRRQGRI